MPTRIAYCSSRKSSKNRSKSSCPTRPSGSTLLTTQTLSTTSSTTKASSSGPSTPTRTLVRLRGSSFYVSLNLLVHLENIHKNGRPSKVVDSPDGVDQIRTHA